MTILLLYIYYVHLHLEEAFSAAWPLFSAIKVELLYQLSALTAILIALLAKIFISLQL